MLCASILVTAIAAVMAVPLGVGSAIFQVYYCKGWIARWQKRFLELLAGVPSIVFGFWGVFFCQLLGMGYSILAGGMTLACMILPILLRTTLSAMEALSRGLRASAHALGLSKATVLFKVLLPQAVPGIVVGATIGVARALSETAALIFTSGYATRSPETLMDSGRAISVHIYELATEIPNEGKYAAASALVLLVALLIINLGVNFLSEKWLKSVT